MTGRVLGQYRLDEKLGAGAMGEVYLARDEKLNRDVAVKVLPAGALSDEAARRRFRKEANVLSRISHPHIATIHDFDSADGIDFLVMELVPGPSIDEELRRGPLPEKDVVRLGGQMARGLQAAHEQGVIHRDLKPSNLRLTEDGMLKILDFGVARLEQNARRAAGDATATETAEGQVVGTLPYMSPEQLRGRGVDARTDLYSAGVALYEMATGKRLFSKRSTAELTEAILNENPAPPREVDEGISPGLEAVILKALDKDPELRYQTAKDLRADLERLQQRSGTVTTPARAGPDDVTTASGRGARSSRLVRERLAWALALVVLAGLAALLAWRDLTRPAEARPVVRFPLEIPEEVPVRDIQLAVSPDGRQVAFTPGLPGVREHQFRLWVRSLDSQTARLLDQTAAARGPGWSPDGSQIAVCTGHETGMRIERVDVATGAVLTICRVPDTTLCAFGSWSRDGRVLFSASNHVFKGRVYSAPAVGGAATLVWEPDASTRDVGYWAPEILPDDRRFIFAEIPEEGEGGIWVATVERPEDRRLLLPGIWYARYSPTGHLLYVRDETLLAHPFDLARAELTGEPVAIASSVATFTGLGQSNIGLFAISTNGVLAYAKRGTVDSELAWFDREGRRLGTVGEPGQYIQIELSPDEGRVAAQMRDVQRDTTDLWTLDVARGVATRVTSEPGNDEGGVWSSDSGELFLGSRRPGADTTRLLRTRADGSGPESVLLESPSHASVEDLSADGSTLLYVANDGEATALWELPLAEDGVSRQLVETEGRVEQAQISPDGRWLAYCSDRTGGWEVYLAPFRREGERVRVSPEGGRQPRWRGDGRELYFATGQGQLLAVPVRQTAETIDVGLPRELFEIDVGTADRHEYAVTKDGQRFLVITPVEDSGWSVQVVLNWPSLLE